MTATRDSTSPSGGGGTPLGPGRLVLVVGPSGAGKDTVLARCAEALAGAPGVVVARRVVTRAPSRAEDNLHLDDAAFEAARAAGAFALSWRAHGHAYGVPIEIEAAIRAGATVLCNASRSIAPAARARFADVLVVEITAPPEVLAARLAARGRASDGDLAARLARSPAPAGAADVVVDNSGPVDLAAEALLRAVGVAREGAPG